MNIFKKTKKKNKLLSYISIFSFSILILNNFRLEASNSCSNSCIDLLNLYTLPEIFIPGFLQRDFYKNVNNICVRDLTSIPNLVRSFKTEPFNDNGLEINLFYSGISQGIFFTKDSNSLSSVINFSNFIKSNKNFFDFIVNNDFISAVNFQLIENIADYFKVQQHRLGGIIDGFFNFKNIDFYLQIPVVYQINNVHIEKSKQELIENQFQSFSPAAKEDQENFTESFIKDNFVPDFLGIDRPLIGIQKKNIIDNIDFEIFTQLPVGFQFKEGLIGKNFKNVHNEKINFEFSKEISNLILNLLGQTCSDDNAADKNFLNLLGITLKRIADGVFYIPFSEKPFSIGTGITLNVDLKDEVKLTFKSRFSYSADYEKYRYGFNSFDKKFFELNYKTSDEKEACDILKTLDNEFVKRALLVPFKACISRPFEFQNSLFLTSKTDSLNFKLGTDLWYKSAESLYFKNENIADLNGIIYTEGPSAFQNSLLAELNYFKELANKNILKFSIGCNIPIYSRGIGKELTVSGSFEVSF